jgi:hypothetical protein
MKASQNDHYTYRVTWSDEDQEHIGLCTEFPSLSWLATTPETALRGIRKVVAEVVAESEIRNLLEQQRVRIQEEIANYPPPITACDAQFNHLLEQRSRIARELACMTKT